MRVSCTAETMRRAEAGAGVPEPVLMQRAASGLAVTCMEMLRLARGRVGGASVVGLIGTGNNGGDALWAMSRLAQRGVAVTAVGEAARMHPEGLAAFRRARGRVVAADSDDALEACRAADLALDGIVGIGGTGALRESWRPLVREMRAAGVPMVAVDIPSGVAADTGEVVAPRVAGVAPGAAAVDAAPTAVSADVTVTFGVLKPGLLLAPGKAHSGLVTVVDIGLRGCDLTPAAQVLSLHDLAGPALQPEGYKYSRGVVQVSAGCADYPGAAHLATAGARGSAVGMVALHTGPGAHPDSVVAAHPDIVVSAPVLFPRADARIIGPGLGESPAAMDLLRTTLADRAPVVVDASGLALLATPVGREALSARSRAGGFTIVTPHEGEFRRLGFDLTGGRLAAAQRAAAEMSVVLVLKGPGTVVAGPDGSAAYVDTFGGAELGTAGSGDVLAGLCGGLLAGVACSAGAGLSWADVAMAAARAVGLHGLAGRLASESSGAVTAPDIAASLPRAMRIAAAARDDLGLARRQ